ncbi:MAG TPA: nucleotide disphospho-sugar-binding domain-containing protein [Thermoanaerobaculia bacterium]
MKFLFCSLDSPGYLYPSIGFASVLASRGHEVTFVADITSIARLSGCHFQRLPRGPQDGSSFKVAKWFDPRQIAIQVKHIEYALQKFEAEVLIGQSLTLGPLLVSERLGIPVALLGFCTYLFPTSDLLMQNQNRSEPEKRLALRYEEMMDWLNKARALFRLPKQNGNCRETPLLGDLFLLRSVPELEPNPHDLPDRVHLVGSCLWDTEEPDSDLQAWLDATTESGYPLIYVQHGRLFHIPSFWPQLLDAFGKTDFRVAASIGRMDSEIGAIPENFFVRPHIPQAPVLRSARAVVTTANSTAVLGALSYGVPSLLLPGGGEQPDVAALAERRGVARTLYSEEATPKRICEELNILLDYPGYRERADHYSSCFSAIRGFEKAADLVEILGKTRKPVLRSSCPAFSTAQ